MQIESHFDFTRQGGWLERYARFDVASYARFLETRDERYWWRLGEKRALRLFHAAARRVPAYKDFLKKHAIRHERIKTIHDFSQLPATSKKNYIERYALAERCWDGALTHSSIAAVSSGMSGEPTYWPRSGYQEFEAATTHELLYRTFFEIDRRSALLVICFPMGVYVSGVATLTSSLMVAQKRGYRMMAVSAGNNKQEALKVIRNLHSEFDQVVLVGHPLFVKDIIEHGADAGIQWKKMRVRMMFCSEGFSEQWRSYVLRQVSTKPSITDAVSVYGSSDLLLMAYETPLTILIRQLAERHTGVRALFGASSVPSMFQYNPLHRYIETVGGDLVFTAASGVPLIRYNIHDGGDVYGFGKMHEMLTSQFPRWKSALRERGRSHPVWQLPLVTLRGRSDYTVIFYAANIYPEHIRAALEYRPFFRMLTGKFTLRKCYSRAMDEYLEIHVELQKGIHPSARLSRAIRDRVVQKLKKLNIEYVYISGYDKDMRPHIHLWPYQQGGYFKPGLKPRYIAT